MRIVQEAITNVVRHSGATSATIALQYDAESLAVTVQDSGRGLDHPDQPQASMNGTGIVGMRERAEALGGSLQVGPGEAGGVRVHAVLPVRPADCTGGAMIRVALVDDQALLRAGFRALVDAEEDMSVVAEASGGDEAVEVVRLHRPDVVLMDIRMPGGDGLDATRRIIADSSIEGVRVVILTTFDLDEYVFEAVRIGASGFLVKDTEPAELLAGIRAVAAGDALLSPGVTRRLIAEFADRSRGSADPTALDALTDREREVVGLVGEGLNNEEIGARLFMSPATAKTHVSRAMTKLHARDRAQLVVIAYESGLVRPGWS